MAASSKQPALPRLLNIDAPTAAQDLIPGYARRPLKGLFRFRNDLVRPTDRISGEVCFIGLQHIESNTGRRLGEDIIRPGELEGRKFRFSPGEIVYGYLRPYLNKVWIADREGVCSVDQYVLQPNNSLVDTVYLACAMRSQIFLEQSEQLTGAFILPRLRSNLLESIEIPVPPLPEQRRMVARIEEFTRRVEKAQRLRAEAVEWMNGWTMAVLNTVFENLALEHSLHTLKGLFRFRNDLLRPVDEIPGEVRFVGLQHIERNTGRKLGEDIIRPEELNGRKFRFSPGEIVYGYLRPYLNKVWIADCEGLCSVDQYVLKPDSSQVETAYLAYAMRSPMFLQQSEQLTGAFILPRLRSNLLESIQIPVPPLTEQRRVVAYLDNVQVKAAAINAAQAETQKDLDALMPNVLAKAFAGEL